MSRYQLALLCLLVAGCGTSSEKHYELVARRAQHTFLVYVPPEYAQDRDAYFQAIRQICDEPDEPCIIMFWNDRDKVWQSDRSEMTSQQAAAQVAGFHRNPASGLNNFYWLRDGERIDEGPVELPGAEPPKIPAGR